LIYMYAPMCPRALCGHSRAGNELNICLSVCLSICVSVCLLYDNVCCSILLTTWQPVCTNVHYSRWVSRRRSRSRSINNEIQCLAVRSTQEREILMMRFVFCVTSSRKLAARHMQQQHKFSSKTQHMQHHWGRLATYVRETWCNLCKRS
jgi:hypothetical protein